jgi:dTDP-4-dehydrorhamnose reductase
MFKFKFKYYIYCIIIIIMSIILFGSTGMLGNYVLNVLKSNFDVICISRNDFDIETNNWKILDELLKKYILSDNYVIVNCVGIIPQKHNFQEYRKYIKVNTLFPHKLSEYSLKYNCKFIHITTDCVFDGTKGNYNINDKHTASNIYGISKSEGEPLDATIIRTSIIGEEKYGKKSLLEWIKSNQNSEINGFNNHLWNGVTCLTLANIIKQIITQNIYWKGVKHIFSPNIVTKYDLCKIINETYDLNIKINLVNDKVIKNMTLSGEEFFVIDTIENQIKELKNNIF